MQLLTNWHSLECDDCLSLLESSETGLPPSVARQRLQQIGPNHIEQSASLAAWRLFLEQFTDFMTLVLLVATLISGMLGEYLDSLCIIAIIMVNALLGFMQEFRAEKSIEALARLSSPQIEAMRGGKRLTLDVVDLVPGDLVFVHAGVRVPADMRLIKAMALEVEEAALTGESIPVRKTTAPVAEHLLLHDRANMLYAGTIVTRGHGIGLVTATGMQTEMGRIAEMMQSVQREQTPLQRRLAQLGRYIVGACLLICAAVVAMGIQRGEDPTGMFLAGVSLAVAAIPEGLPAIVTIALALGVQRMIKINAIVRRLPAVETLGCSSIICSDKTGTLTKNEMTVRQIWLASGNIQITGDGYAPYGELLQGMRTLHFQQSLDLRQLLTIALLCNNSDVVEQEIGIGRMRTARSMFVAKGDPTEAALVALAAKAGLQRKQLAGFAVLDEVPFDSSRKRMSVLVVDPTHQNWLYSKGAPEMLLPLCSHYLDGDRVRPLTPDLREQISDQLNCMGDRALRVLAVAYRPVVAHRVRPGKTADWERDLVFVGLLGMIDPPRPEVKEALRICRHAGIQTVMITGDHARTAKAIGVELGLILPDERVVTGDALDKLPAESWQKIVRNTRIFARVSPHHKLQIVRSLKQSGQVVAMTGDGINDAPALMEADIGVAMGLMGTDVAKEAASLVLGDDNFATIVAAIREGRAIYDNIRKFIRYLLSCNVGELLTVFLTMFLRMPLPLKPLQILWVNLVTDGLPAMALGVEPEDKDIMHRPPRDKNENIFSRGLARRILSRGFLIGLTTTIVFAWSLRQSGDLKLARTMVFATLVFCQLFHVFDCRSETLGILEKGLFSNLPLLVAVFLSSIMFLAVVYLPSLQVLFDTVTLGRQEWLIVLSAAGAPTIFITVRRWLRAKLFY